MSKITIDQIGISAHERYARDQKHLDRTIMQEAGMIPAQSEVLTTCAIYFSFWETLFEWTRKNIPWASFMPPPKYFAQRSRCFSYRLIPTIGSEEDEQMKEQTQDFDGKPDDNQNEVFLEEMKRKISDLEARSNDSSIVEKDKLTLIKLFDAVAGLNGILKEIYSKKLQYQKG